MSIYSEQLRELIRIKNIRVADLITYCNVERSVMYRIINGKRNPASVELVRKIADFLQITPSESLEYYDAYYRTIYGEERFVQNEEVKKFLLQFNTGQYDKLSLKRELNVIETKESEIIALCHKEEIDCVVQFLLDEAFLTEQASDIQLMTQPDYTYLMEHLATLAKQDRDLQIQHIVCLHDEKQTTPFGNLTIMSKVLNIYMKKSGGEYKVRYYYDNIDSHFHNMNLFPNLLLTGNGLLTYTSDLQRGLYIKNKAAIELYRSCFTSFYDRSQPLIEIFESFAEEFSVIGSYPAAKSSHEYALASEPCIIPFLTEEMLVKYLKPEVVKNKELLGSLKAYIKGKYEKIQNNAFVIHCTLDGIREFLETGHLQEVPSYILSAIDETDRIYLIRQVQKAVWERQYRILKNELERIPSDIHVFVTNQYGYLMFGGKTDDIRFVELKESGIIQQFAKFMESLNIDLEIYERDAADELIERELKRAES